MNRHIRVFAFTSVLLALCACGGGGDPEPIVNETYFPQVKTILKANCMSCHSAAGAWSGRPVQFDTDADIALLAASIKASVADPVTFINRRMPQTGSLSAADIDVIVKWQAADGKVTD